MTLENDDDTWDVTKIGHPLMEIVTEKSAINDVLHRSLRSCLTLISWIWTLAERISEKHLRTTYVYRLRELGIQIDTKMELRSKHVPSWPIMSRSPRSAQRYLNDPRAPHWARTLGEFFRGKR